MRYPVVLLDLDHTLYDFDASKAESFVTAMNEQGIEDDDRIQELKAVLATGEQPLWAQVEAGELDLVDLNQARFDYLQTAGIPGADATQMAVTYRRELGRTGGLYPGAQEFLVTLREHCRLGMITNGYGDVQRSRMALHELDQYFDAVTISEESGLVKPDPAFFAHTLAQLDDPKKSDVLVVGDSLTSDMAGGAAAGLATCWFNPHGRPNSSPNPVDYDVAGYDEIVAIVLGSD